MLLSRAAITSGADITQILMLNTDYFLKIERIQTLDELNEWLAMIISRFIGYVFEFTAVKHADVLHKAARYIREHYREKLTLDVAGLCGFEDQSYFTKVFKKIEGISPGEYRRGGTENDHHR